MAQQKLPWLTDTGTVREEYKVQGMDLKFVPSEGWGRKEWKELKIKVSEPTVVHESKLTKAEFPACWKVVYSGYDNREVNYYDDKDVWKLSGWQKIVMPTCWSAKVPL